MAQWRKPAARAKGLTQEKGIPGRPSSARRDDRRAGDRSLGERSLIAEENGILYLGKGNELGGDDTR